MTETVIYVLIALLISEQAIFLVSIHRLINKVMSGNYGNYVAAENQLKESKKELIKVPLPPEEDLGTLTDVI